MTPKNFEEREIQVDDFLFGPNRAGKNTYHIVIDVDDRGFWTHYIGRTGTAVKKKEYHLNHLGKNFVTIYPEYINEDNMFSLLEVSNDEWEE